MKPKLLITGGAGFLGTHLLKQATQFAATGTLHQTAATAISDVSFHVCDLQRPNDIRVLLDHVQPEVVIHTACSDQGNHPEAIISAAGHLATQTAERHIHFIHLSTDHVFDGTAAPYTEQSDPSPIHPYGQAKAQAEALVQALHPEATIVRTSLLYNLQTPDPQTARLIQLTKSDELFRLFVDEWRSPMWVVNLAEVLLELAKKDYAGILHVGGPEQLSRWDLGIKLLDHFGITPTSNIQKGTIEESDLIRPPNLALDSSIAQQLLQTPLLSLPEAHKIAQNLTL